MTRLPPCNILLSRGGSPMVEPTTHDLKVKGLNSADTEKEKIANK